jgi:gamma-glutamyltranspeptidase/glutathione hydrolase
LASQAGAQILAKGGTAVDAAVAANAVLGVVSPMMCGMGGDLFAIVYEARSGQVWGLNASGWSPAGLSLDRLRAQGVTKMPQNGIDTVTVPGAVDGWDQLLRRFGRRSFREVLAPAVRLAEEGFPVSELVAGAWRASEGALRKDANAMRTFLPGGRAPETGEVFRNPDLAWSYGQVARSGRRAFYEGRIAGRLLEYSRRLGGTLAADDLSKYRSEWVKPITTSYRGWTVYEIPPNGQGIAALIMLNLMEQFPLAEDGLNSANALHAMIEAKKLAYADMLRYVADPRHSRVPVAGLLAKDYARARARLIDQRVASPQAAAGDLSRVGNDTTYLCAVDREGNLVSLIQSIYYSFGSGLVADGTGFALQNRGGLFSLDPEHPNVLAGRKRPLHTIIPGFLEKDEVRIAFGIMGGWNQAQAHAQFVSNIADHRLNLQAALEAPRFTKMTFEGTDVQMESRIPEAVRAELESRGHQLQVRGPYTQAVGGGQAVMRDYRRGVNYGASDPRKDGAAVPELVPGFRDKR